MEERGERKRKEFKRGEKSNCVNYMIDMKVEQKQRKERKEKE